MKIYKQIVFYSAADEITDDIGGFEIHSELPRVLLCFAENTLIQRINETQDLIALFIGEIIGTGPCLYGKGPLPEIRSTIFWTAAK